MKYIYRLSPCPSYDVAYTEDWLGRMAENGLFLSENGFFGGVGVFEKAEPREMRYRMVASPKGTSMWNDDGGLPRAEQRDMMADAGWKYVCNRGDFFIYRSCDPSSPEPESDPAVQALALASLSKRQKSLLFTQIFYTIFYPLFLFRGSMLMLMIEAGSVIVLSVLALIIWSNVTDVKKYLALKKMTTGLKRGLPLSKIPLGGYRWRRLLLAARTALTLFVIILIGVNLRSGDVGVTPINFGNKSICAIEAYGKDLPFADLGEMLDGEYSPIDMGRDDLRYNYIKEWSDMLAPTCIKLAQHGDVKSTDGAYSGALYVSYYKTVSPFVARIVAADIQRADRLKNLFSSDYQALRADRPEGFDYFAFYKSDTFYQTLVIAKGDRVLKADFFSFNDLGEHALDFWIKRMADSVR